jgi:NADH:ubiquinone oxidoreductase subunit 3 (subunit A)
MGKNFPIAPVEHPWATIVVLLIAAVVFGAIPLSLASLWARLFSPAKPGIQKNATYECGLESQGDAWIQLNVSYYLYAIVFLIFDVEAVFLLPFAAAFSGLSLAACLAMLVFLLLLVEGLIWAWQKGVLTWA